MTTIAARLQGAHLVVTGATGFVGKVWLSHVLCHVPEIGRLTLLVRGGRRRDARARMAELFDTSPAFRPLREAHGPALGAFLDARVDVVDADLTRPRMGLEAATWEALARSADAVVHLAGLTDFQPDPRKGVPANVHGTRHVADLVERLKVPRLVHVSTCYVAGTREGVVDETLTPGVSPRGVVFDVDDEVDAVEAILAEEADATTRIERVADRARALGWPNLYTFTKGLAEHHLAGRDLDLTIVRPSVVESARSFPFRGWNEGLNTSAPIMWFCGTAFRALPSTADHVFDIVPVDTVARWLTVVTARHLTGEAPAVHQFASSDVNPATFGRIVELTALGKRRHARRPGATWTERLVAQLDVAPRPHGEQPYLTPERLEVWVREVHDLLGEIDPAAPLPRPIADRVGVRLKTRLRRTRARVGRRHRELGRLRKMLDAYRPFVHDHDWTFRTDHTRAAVDALDPADAAVFGDTLHDLCWRTYWLDVQYEGMVRWSFPLLHGQAVPEDPPSNPPLELGGSEARDTDADVGVA